MGAMKLLLTAEQFDERDEGKLSEIPRPGDMHNRVLMCLSARLHDYFETNGGGEVLISPQSRTAARIPDIAVEITTRVLIHVKMRRYFETGVKEIWLINPQSHEAEVWKGPALADATEVADTLASPLLPGFSLPLADLFQ
jgi:Uma2 family endonuclease